MCFKIQHLQLVSFIYYITIYKVWFTEQILNLTFFFVYKCISRMQYQQQFVIYCALHLTRSYFHRCIVAQLRVSYSLYGSTIQKLVCRVCNIDIITTQTKVEREKDREKVRLKPRLTYHQSFPCNLTSNRSHLKSVPGLCSRRDSLKLYFTNDVARDLSFDDGILRLKFSFGWIQPQEAFCSHRFGGVAAELRLSPHVAKGARNISLCSRCVQLQYLRADSRKIIGKR